MRLGEDVGGLGHEVDAAEHDEVGLRPRRRELGQLERVAGEVRVPDDLVTLVVVAQDDQPAAERAARLRDAVLDLGRAGGRDELGKRDLGHGVSSDSTVGG